MANISASHWGYKYWDEQFTSFIYDMEFLYEELWYGLIEVSEAEVVSYTDTKIIGKTLNGGDISVSGRNFNSYYENIVISSIDVQENQLSMQLSGELYLGGYLGVMGVINNINIESEYGKLIGSGSFYTDYYGDGYAINSVEKIWTDTGFVQSHTNENGEYVFHQASVSNNNVTLEGNWGYSAIYSWQDLLSGADTLSGTAQNDYLEGYGGDDILRGDSGTDTAVFSGQSANYSIERYADYIQVTDHYSGRDGADTLYDIERLAFSDAVIAWDTGRDGTAGQAYRIYQAAFDRVPDPEGLGYWIQQMDQGMDLIEVSARFIDSNEFRERYGDSPTHSTFLNKLYENVLDRTPDQEGYDWWIDQLENNPEKSWERVLADFSESPENLENMIEATGSVVTYDLF